MPGSGAFHYPRSHGVSGIVLTTPLASTALDIRHGHREKAGAFLKTRNRLLQKRPDTVGEPQSMIFQ
jgi:hypothetical protein